MLVIMTATFVLLIEGEIDTNHLFKVSSFEDAYKQAEDYIKELDVPATLISSTVKILIQSSLLT
jgi:prephenate dehydratase